MATRFWLHLRRFAGRLVRGMPSGKARPGPRPRLRIEHLEDRCTPSITPVLPAFGVSPASSGIGSPAVAMANDGHYVIAWAALTSDGVQQVFARTYGANNRPEGRPTLVWSSPPGGALYEPTTSVAMNAAGTHYAIVWNDALKGVIDYVDMTPTPAGPVPSASGQVNARGTDVSQPSVAMAADGRFVVAWQKGDIFEPNTIWMRRFDALGHGIGGDRREATGIDPHVARAPGGRLIVAWTGPAYSGVSYSLYGRTGKAVLEDRTVAVESARKGVSLGSVGMADNGSFVVAWYVEAAAPGLPFVRAERFTAGGRRLAPPLSLGSAVTFEPGLAVGGDGRFVVTYPQTNGLYYAAASPFGHVLGTGLVDGNGFALESAAAQRGDHFVIAYDFNDTPRQVKARPYLETPDGSPGPALA